MILYGAPVSPFVRKLIVFCAEAGIDFELKVTRPHGDDPGFRAASPFGKIPAMDDDGFLLSDSSAILHYLDARRAAGLIPADPRNRGLAVMYDEIADTVLFPAMQPIFWNRIVQPVFNRSEPDEAAIRQAEEQTLPPVMNWLEATLPKDGFIFGERMSAADIVIASPLVNYVHVYGEVPASRYPTTAAFAARMFTRPSFVEARVAEDAMIAKARAVAG